MSRRCRRSGDQDHRQEIAAGQVRDWPCQPDASPQLATVTPRGEGEGQDADGHRGDDDAHSRSMFASGRPTATIRASP